MVSLGERWRTLPVVGHAVERYRRIRCSIVQSRSAERMIPMSGELWWPQVVGQVLRAAREARGLSREQMARELGMSVPTIGNAENGHRPPPPATLDRWSAALAVDPSVLRRLLPLRDGFAEQSPGTLVEMPEDGDDRIRVATAAVRSVLDDVLDGTDATVLSDDPTAGQCLVRLPSGEVSTIRLRRPQWTEIPLRADVAGALRHLLEGPDEGRPANLFEKWLQDQEGENFRLDPTTRPWFRMWLTIGQLRPDELERVRGYVDRLLEERDKPASPGRD